MMGNGMDENKPDFEDSEAMREHVDLEDGGLRQDISNAIVGLYKEHFGRGPFKCRTYLQPDLVVVVMGGGYTASEQTLFQAGKWYEVREARQHWQDSMQVRFVDTVEALTDRKVKAFMSASHQDPDLAVELFVLEPVEA
jgi:uncharacterized protein YbcI